MCSSNAVDADELTLVAEPHWCRLCADIFFKSLAAFWGYSPFSVVGTGGNLLSGELTSAAEGRLISSSQMYMLRLLLRLPFGLSRGSYASNGPKSLLSIISCAMVSPTSKPWMSMLGAKLRLEELEDARNSSGDMSYGEDIGGNGGGGGRSLVGGDGIGGRFSRPFDALRTSTNGR